MARRSTPAPLQSANLSCDQMEAAIPKIDRRIAELEAFDPASIKQRGDPALKSLELKLETFLTDLFGADTLEYKRYHYSICELDRAGHNVYNATPLHEVIRSVMSAIPDSIAQLNTIKEDFLEKLEDAGRGKVLRPLKAYEGLDLHPEIERAAGQLFRDGHYKNAIQDAVIALNNLVRLRSGLAEDGTTLMEQAFSPKSPILKFNGLADDSDRNEQKGFMMMFSGAVTGLRNPRAHKLIQDDPERALEFIAFVSLLAKLVDSAKR
jgi:uncharacterized protein (TIGR02391 family)